MEPSFHGQLRNPLVSLEGHFELFLNKTPGKNVSHMQKLFLGLMILTVIFLSPVAQAFTLEDVVARGVLKCGVSTGSPGFSSVDDNGNWAGFDVDICRAVAAATLSDAEKVEFLPLAEHESFTALLSGEVDILSRHLAWTFTKDTALAVHFTGVSFFDGQGLMAASSLNALKSDDLQKVRICSPVGSPLEENLVDYLDRKKIEYKFVRYENLDLAVKGFENGNCDLFSLAKSQLNGLRLGLLDPGKAVVLPEEIAKEPLGPVVRQGDDNWFNIVRWCLYSLINAEELGITSGNLEEMRISNRLAVQRLFTLGENGAKGLGLPNDWSVQIIRQVGNYGEIFDRNFGPGSPMRMERGLNELWTRGGLQYAPPIR